MIVLVVILEKFGLWVVACGLTLIFIFIASKNDGLMIDSVSSASSTIYIFLASPSKFPIGFVKARRFTLKSYSIEPKFVIVFAGFDRSFILGAS